MKRFVVIHSNKVDFEIKSFIISLVIKLKGVGWMRGWGVGKGVLHMKGRGYTSEILN